MKQLYIIPYTTNEKGLIDKIYYLDNPNISLYNLEKSTDYFNKMLSEIIPSFDENDEKYKNISDNLHILKESENYCCIILNVSNIDGLIMKTNIDASKAIDMIEFNEDEKSSIQGLFIYNMKSVLT